MPTSTEIAITSTTLGTATSTIIFDNIPSTYSDLRVVLVAASTGASDYNVFTTLNSDSGTNYSWTRLQGSGSAASSDRVTGYSYFQNSGFVGLKTTPSLTTYDFMSYCGSTNKTVLISNSADYNGTGNILTLVGLWRSTSAITSITFTSSSTTFAIGTTATLYGIL